MEHTARTFVRVNVLRSKDELSSADGDGKEHGADTQGYKEMLLQVFGIEDQAFMYKKSLKARSRHACRRDLFPASVLESASLFW